MSQSRPLDTCAPFGELNDRMANGDKWHGLLEFLVGLYPSLHLVAPSARAWAPDLGDVGTWEDAWKIWRDHETANIEQIHATAKEWVRSRQFPKASSEILYYLGLRHRAALNLVESSFLPTERGPSSLIHFRPSRRTTSPSGCSPNGATPSPFTSRFPKRLNHAPASIDEQDRSLFRPTRPPHIPQKRLRSPDHDHALGVSRAPVGESRLVDTG